jgi:hypothetical protein
VKHNFDEAQGIILDLQKELECQRQFSGGFQRMNPCCEELQDPYFIAKESRCWLHGATEILEANELERWLFERPPLSDTAKEKASKCIKYWKEWLAQTGAYYEPFDDFELEKPLKGEVEGKGSRLEWRALKCFLAYMRNIAPEEIAFIEQIFPKKMGFSGTRIIRLINPEVYPISQEVAGDILRELARFATQGRLNGILTALESLGLSWLCLTASRLRLPTHLEMIEQTKVSAISLDGENPTINIPTLFGDRKIRISKRVANFLIALFKIPSKSTREMILQSPRRSLTRTFDRAMQSCEVNSALGNITYVTLLSPPHIWDKDYRFVPK